MLIRLLSSIEEMKQTQKLHSNMLQSVMRQLKGSEKMTTVAQLPERIRFPLESLAEIDDLEIHLEDAATNKKVVNIFLIFLLHLFMYLVYFTI